MAFESLAGARRGMLTMEELRSAVGEGEIDTVVLAFTDMQGRLAGKRLSAEFFLDEVAEHYSEGCNYLLAVDVDMNTVDGYAMSSWDRGYGDFVMVPDMNTLRRLPWHAGTALVIADLTWLDGAPVLASPRQILAAQTARLAERGWTAMAGTELEFIVYQDTYEQAAAKDYRDLVPANQYNVDYSILGTSRVEPLLRRIRNQMAGAGLYVESAKGECNLGQHEIAFRYAEAVATCDNHSIYKTGAKEIAAQDGNSITFMAKPNAREGNSCHIHLSLRAGGAPVLAGDGPYGLSPLGEHFLAGQLAAMRELVLCYAPNINSYKRYVPGSFAPTSVRWGPDNRTCALRLVGHGSSLRVENRVPGGDVNPYLAVAAMIAAGLHGIDNELPLEPPMTGNAYADTTARVPHTLRDALDLWEKSELARESFGAEVVEHYANYAKVELAAYDAAVTDWELRRCFERLLSGVHAMSVFTVLNPATEEPVTTVTQASAEEADEAIARAAAAQAAWRDVAPGDRARLLRSFAAAVDSCAEELAGLEVAGSGHPVGQARWEAGHVRDVLLYYSAAPERLTGRQIPVPGGLNVTFHEPVGVVGLIVPWNFPMPILSWGMAPALAAGCAVVAKPAEATPLTAMRIGSLALEAGLPEGVFQVLPGKGSVVGQRLVDDPLVRKIVFTGSTDVGRQIMAGCARTVKRLTLELGGKSANIVFADADLERAAATAPYAVFDNAGQDCCARSRILVQRSVLEKFMEHFERAVKGVVVGDPASAATEMGPLISAAHRAHVASYVPAGAPVAFRGEAPGGPGFWFPPTVLAPVSPSDPAYTEEVFGPVVTVTPFADEAEAVAIANDTPYGLSGSIWTSDVGRAIRVARAVESGNLSVNSHSSVRYWTPFGGFKQSGLGRELGPDAPDAFTEIKNVFISTDVPS